MNRSCLFTRRRLHSSISQCIQRRSLLTLAIETSCDDTSVAVLEKHENNSATLHFHRSITSDNRSYGGVHPIAAHESHQQQLAGLVNTALTHLPIEQPEIAHHGNALLIQRGASVELLKKPDFVTVTRGPGMRTNLITGIDTAKGLAIAWQVPFLGVNHMQAHALTPRLVSALDAVDGISDEPLKPKPAFPFLSLLVSGGNSMLVHSRDICSHEILASTTDMAIGDMLDKCARLILPKNLIESSPSVSYGPSLELYAFPDTGQIVEYDYHPLTSKRYGPKSQSNVSTTRTRSLMPLSWSIAPPMSKTQKGGPAVLASKFAFSEIGSSVKRILNRNPDISMGDAERRVLAREVMRAAFEHLTSRVLVALKGQGVVEHVKSLVVSGGVASNQYLKHILRTTLDANGHREIDLVFPPPELCTDNAAMIAWTGIEMWEAGYRTNLDAMALKKWSIDSKAQDGGILEAKGWRQEILQRS